MIKNTLFWLSTAIFLMFFVAALIVDDDKVPSAGLPLFYMSVVFYIVACAALVDLLFKRTISLFFPSKVTKK